MSFAGHQPRKCREHFTGGYHAAWCVDCQEWCYNVAPCHGCEAGITERQTERVNDVMRALRLLVAVAEARPADHPQHNLVHVAALRDVLDRGAS